MDVFAIFIVLFAAFLQLNPSISMANSRSSRQSFIHRKKIWRAEIIAMFSQLKIRPKIHKNIWIFEWNLIKALQVILDN